jgi:hypothetical protein
MVAHWLHAEINYLSWCHKEAQVNVSYFYMLHINIIIIIIHCHAIA